MYSSGCQHIAGCVSASVFAIGLWRDVEYGRLFMGVNDLRSQIMSDLGVSAEGQEVTYCVKCLKKLLILEHD